MVPDTIRTARLLLRPWRFADVRDVLAYSDDEAWGRYLPVPLPYTELDGERFIASQILLEREQQRGWALQLGERVVGGINLRLMQQSCAAELGYSVARAHWGTGLATEAARAVTVAAFEGLPLLERVQASADPHNLGSVRVMQKLGMQSEGISRKSLLLRGEPRDQVWYALLRQDWEKSR